MNLNSQKNFVSASTMTDRVKLYAPSIAAPDSEANSDTTYTLQQTVWGDWRPENGSRDLQEMMLNFNAWGRLFIYFGVTINKFYKIEIDGITFVIHTLKDYHNAHQYYEIVIHTNEQA